MRLKVWGLPRYWDGMRVVCYSYRELRIKSHRTSCVCYKGWQHHTWQPQLLLLLLFLQFTTAIRPRKSHHFQILWFMNVLWSNSCRGAQIPKDGHLPKHQKIHLWKVCDSMASVYFFYFGIHIYTTISNFRIFLLL